MNEPAPRGVVTAAAELERGRRAYDRRDWRDALEALSRADRATALDPADLERLAAAAALVGDDAAAIAPLERLHDLHAGAGDLRGAARAAFWIGFRLVFLGEMGRGSGWLARARDHVERHGDDCVERGYLLIPATRELLFRKNDPAAARAAAIDAAACAERFGDPDLASLAHMAQGHAEVALGRHEEGLAQLDHAMLSTTTGRLTPLVTGILYCTVIGCCQSIYEIDRAREWTASLAAWCGSQPQLAAFNSACRVHRSELLQILGAWPEAIEEARLAARAAAVAPTPDTAAACYQQGEILRLRGDFAGAEAAYHEASRQGRAPQPGLALLRLAQGQTDAAAAAIRHVVGAASNPLMRTRYLPAAVEILVAAGDLDGADAAARDLTRIASHAANPVLDAMAAHAAGSLHLARGDAGAAIEPLRHAFDGWQRAGAPYLAARIRVPLAVALEALGDAEGARLERDGARATFEALGAAADLAALGAPGGGRGDDAHGLTARELEVLRLVATGRTNREIAQELFLSGKTIDRHLGNIFTKLDVHTRAAATAFAYEHQLV